jgi:hypothetical protein
MDNWDAVWRAARLASVSAWLFPLVIMEESVCNEKCPPRKKRVKSLRSGLLKQH